MENSTQTGVMVEELHPGGKKQKQQTVFISYFGAKKKNQQT